MSLRKLCFYTMLAAILACAAARRLNRDSKEFSVPEANTGRNDPSLAASFRPKSEMLPADFQGTLEADYFAEALQKRLQTSPRPAFNQRGLHLRSA